MSNRWHHATRRIRHARRISARREIALIVVIMLLLCLGNDADENLCWKLATLATLSLWLVSKSIARKKRTPDHERSQANLAHVSRLAEMGQLTAGILHDLASPISAIIINLKGIQDKQHRTESIQEHLSVSMRASIRIATFISLMRKHMRSDSTRESFLANEVVEDAIALFHHRALQSRVELRFSSSERISLHGHSAEFYQIASNLISNAIDSHEDLEQGEILVSLERDGGQVILRVMDRGSGIEPNTLPKIFDRFFTTKPKETATGIGLSVTKEIVEREFKGSIHVKTAVGKGSTFTVCLPSSSDTSSP